MADIFAQMRRTPKMVATAEKEWKKFLKADLQCEKSDEWEEDGIYHILLNITYNGIFFYEFSLERENGKWYLMDGVGDTWNAWDDEKINGFDVKDIFDMMREDPDTIAKCRKVAREYIKSNNLKNK